MSARPVIKSTFMTPAMQDFAITSAQVFFNPDVDVTETFKIAYPEDFFCLLVGSYCELYHGAGDCFFN